ncbi:MAG TPA: hypothetical protein VFN96_05390 [Gemmatimonadales bacterium]|nr:hypothetical protein [Gemmatimonadales bacterium]
MHRAGTFGALLLSLAALAGCSAAVPGGTPETPRPDAGPAPGPDPCLVSPADSPLRDTVIVALPAAATARFVEAHENPRPGVVDCEGTARTDSLPGYRVSSADPLILTPAGTATASPVLLVRPVAPGSDPRDLVDRGADVVITDDPATLEYARRRGDLRLVPLAWSTTYVLATPDAPLASALPDSLRGELAREVVRSEARPAPDGGWWESGGGQCRPVSAAPTGVRTVVAVPRGDGTARAIGERLVALLGRDLSGIRLLELGPDEVGGSLANAGAAAFVVPLPRFPSPAPGCVAVHRIPFGLTVVPLVETRSTSVLRTGVPPFRILGDGSVRFLPGREP